MSVTIESETASIDARLDNVESATSSYETIGRGIISGSSQVTFSGINSIPSGIISSSEQLPFGTISSSVQVLGGTAYLVVLNN